MIQAILSPPPIWGVSVSQKWIPSPTALRRRDSLAGRSASRLAIPIDWQDRSHFACQATGPANLLGG